jgi:hypothetical protein
MCDPETTYRFMVTNKVCCIFDYLLKIKAEINIISLNKITVLLLPHRMNSWDPHRPGFPRKELLGNVRSDHMENGNKL